MHQLFATLFALLVALCHHTSVSVRPVEAAELPMVHASPDSQNPTMMLPDRYQLARYTTSDGGYAESACASCRRTTSLSIER